MITLKQAQTESLFHCYMQTKGKCDLWRRTGRTKTWKTKPGFRVPIKFGLRTNAYLTEANAAEFHLPEECPSFAWTEKATPNAP